MILSLVAAALVTAYLANLIGFEPTVVWLLFLAVLFLAKIADAQGAALVRSRILLATGRRDDG